ncbi:PHD finger protein 13-like [Hydra vulgaris]|uniref:PHD finger protein 13-like n=1 Tax=Hydra vulgaris TaxID=6087 RepID=UPI0032EA8042
MSIITEDTESFVTTDSALTTDSTSTTEPSTSCTGSTSATEPSTSCRLSTSTTVPSSFAISPRHFLPIPKQAQRKRISKQRGKTAILNSSPYKRSLMEAKEKKNPKKNKSVKKSNEDTPCLYCEDLYSSSTESWVSCTECHRWAHYSCAGIDERNKKPYFLCELCTSSD